MELGQDKAHQLPVRLQRMIILCLEVVNEIELSQGFERECNILLGLPQQQANLISPKWRNQDRAALETVCCLAAATLAGNDELRAGKLY